MNLFDAGELIKALRKAKGLSQSELCDDMVDQPLLSKIENGKRPSWQVFERLMQRLGEDPQRYLQDYVVKGEKRILDLRIQIKRLLNEGKPSATNEAELLMGELEREKAFKEEDHQQFLLRNKAIIAHQRGEYEEMLSLSLMAIKLTKPAFDEDKIAGYALFYDEIRLIEQIAVAYHHMNENERAIKIFEQLKEAVNKTYNVSNDETPRIKLGILYNLSNALGLAKEYEKAIRNCDEGIKLCYLNYNSFYYPLFLSNKSAGLLYLNKEKEGKEMLKMACALFYGLNRLTELEYTKTGVAAQFGITVSMEWFCHSHQTDAKT